MERNQDRQPKLIGIVCLWLKGVRWLGDGGYNKHFEPGTVGDMRVSESSVDGRVINANFYPDGKGSPIGYGATVWPEWEYVMEGEEGERYRG